MKYYTDGYTLRGNPSPYGGGYSVVDEGGKLIKHGKIEKGEFTNNEAELLGVEYALGIVNEGDTISVDSNVIVGWLRLGNKKVYRAKFPRKDLIEIINRCRGVIGDKKINLMWEGRDFNLAGHFNEAFDTGRPDYLTIKEEREQHLFSIIKEV